MSRTTRTAPLSLLRLVLLALSLMLVASACSGDAETTTTEEDSTDEEEATEEEATEDEATEEEATEEEATEEEATAEEATEEEATEDEPATDEESGELPPETDGVVAARDAALATFPDDWEVTANDPEAGPGEEDEEEENPLNDCLPEDLQGLEGQVNALQIVSASGDFTGPAGEETAFGPPSGKVTVNAYSDVAEANDLLDRFGAAVAEPGFADCVTEAAAGSFGEPPEGSEFDVQISTSVPGIEAEVAIQILVNAQFADETITFDSYFLLASRGDYIVEGEFTGDGSQPFPNDIAAAVMNAVG